MPSTPGKAPCVLLISPGIIKWTDMDFGLPHLVSIGGYVQEQVDVRVELLDLNYEAGDHRHLERVLDELGPFLVIGLSCYSSFDYMRVLTLARFLRKLYPDVPIVSGGYHASALPEDLLFDGSPIDAVIPGEGEAPMLEIVETLLGGGELEKKVWPKGVVEDLDSLPPYKWELLSRYWPRANQIGRKFQLYLARGCVYHCTFCMERAKSGYRWRSYSAERAVAELERLSTFTDLRRWVINLADPLFGFNRKWRRQVLRGIIEKGLLPRQYWTLTRSDDLQDEDISLLARANFSIGIGMESGSPRMLQLMQKGNKPEKYLEAQLRLARSSRKHGLNWAGNIIVGHPGETPESMRETLEFARELFTSASETCGWLSLDPFRLYPGSYVHENMAHYESEYGTRFYHKQWWKSWYDGPFRAEHLDASSSVDFATRVNFMYDNYSDLMGEILGKFRGQGRSVDKVFKRSLEEQRNLISDRQRERLLTQARRTSLMVGSSPAQDASSEQLLDFPLGLRVRDEKVRRREDAVRRLLERGVLRTASLIEALLSVSPHDFMPDDQADMLLFGQSHTPTLEGAPPEWLGVGVYATALEQLNPGAGERAVDALATNGYVSALLAHMVGPTGEVIALHPGEWFSGKLLRERIEEHVSTSLRVFACPATQLPAELEEVDALWFGGALPVVPTPFKLALADNGRLVTFVGPRFARRELVCLTWHDDDLGERVISEFDAPVVAGQNGWLLAPKERQPGFSLPEPDSP